MEWIRSHPYASGLAIVGLCIIAGVLIVQSRSLVSPDETTSAWSGNTAVSDTGTSGASGQTAQQIASEVIQNQAPSNLSVPDFMASSTTASYAPSTTASSSVDYIALLSQLTASSNTSVSNTQGDSGASTVAQAYQFIPTGLVATAAQTPPSMTPDQEAIYNYGNEIGGTIQAFERENPNEAQVLKDQAEDRTNPAKAAALVSLGQGLAGVGARLEAMNDVPSSVSSLHLALAQSYQAIGTKLQLVAKAQSDADFVQAIENYDTAANTFIQNYATMASFFSAHGVQFGQTDPGNVFSFSNNMASL